MKAERVLVVSPRKSGTHLIQKLMALLGYGIYGEPVPAPEGRPSFSLRERLDLAQRYLHPSELERLDLHGDRTEFVRRTDVLLSQLGWMWQVKLAARNLSNLEISRPEDEFTLRLADDAWARPFHQTPARLCWMFHSVDLWRMDQRFLHEWLVEEQPLIVLNLRDPRDALLSMVNFFAGIGGNGFLRFPESAIFGPIMASLPSLSDRLDYALRDPAMPLLADYEAAISLFHHPRVRTVRFEQLVGTAGGGTADAQLTAVDKMLTATGVAGDPNAIAAGLFDRGSFTFHKGQIGGWRDAFTDRHRALFETRFGHLLEVFGYE